MVTRMNPVVMSTMNLNGLVHIEVFRKTLTGNNVVGKTCREFVSLFCCRMVLVLIDRISCVFVDFMFDDLVCK